jgi:amino acid permease
LRKILTRAFSLRSLKNAIIISSALGVISNIQISSGEINILNNLHTISTLSNPIFWCDKQQ